MTSCAREDVGRTMTEGMGKTPRQFFTPFRVGLFWLLALALYFLTPLARYVSWLTLDVPTLNGQIDKHMRDVHDDVPFACLYTVACATGSALLEIRTSLTNEDLVRVKNEIWRRRFENYCAGRTANIGLEHGGGTYPAQDKWVFGHGFGGATGFGQAGSFSAGPWTPCTYDNAYWTREGGIVVDRAIP